MIGAMLPYVAHACVEHGTHQAGSVMDGIGKCITQFKHQLSNSGAKFPRPTGFDCTDQQSNQETGKSSGETSGEPKRPVSD